MAEIDSILDNQEVTATTLNDIAIDLGATSFNGFGTEKFGVDALNEITKNLVTPGILKTGNKCEPTLVEGVLSINTGIIVFNCGAKKKITDEALVIEAINGTYVYALHDTITNTCKIIMSETAPTAETGDFVNICKISNNGKLTDMRNYSAARVDLNAESNSSYSLGKYYDAPLDGQSISLPISGISKIFIHTYVSGQFGFVRLYDVNKGGFFDISANGYYTNKVQISSGSSIGHKAYLNKTEQTDDTLVLTFSGGTAYYADTPIYFYAYGGI